jgi:H+-transporting ATPase
MQIGRRSVLRLGHPARRDRRTGYATGGATYFGKTAELVQSAVTVSHFQKAVLRIGNYLIMLAVTMVTMIIAIGIHRGNPVLETLQFELVLTVAAIPVAMPRFCR